MKWAERMGNGEARDHFITLNCFSGENESKILQALGWPRHREDFRKQMPTDSIDWVALCFHVDFAVAICCLSLQLGCFHVDFKGAIFCPRLKAKNISFRPECEQLLRHSPFAKATLLLISLPGNF